MDEPVIKSVPKVPLVPDALKKREQGQERKPAPRQKPEQKKDPKRIIDTYA